MINNFFYPKLTRKNEEYYYNLRGGFYANYLENYSKIAEDCHYRCVYCDATEKECGGDPFSLDHFRPKHVFLNLFNGILLIHPHNLYLSCQKCNVLKSNDWKGSVDTIDGPSYIEKQGYIDRFKDNVSDFMEVIDTGEVVSVNDNGPANYMIQKMLLNRSNRVYLRRKRMVDAQLLVLSKEITNKIENIILSFNTDNFDNKKMQRSVEEIYAIKKIFDEALGH